MADIDRSSPVPIYYQLKTLIQERIKSGLWLPDDRIPPEREFCEAHGIGRSPLRQALNELAQDGVLVRQPGLGTFVADHVSVDVSSETPIRMICSDSHRSDVLQRISDVWNRRHPDQRILFKTDVIPHNQFYDLLIARVGCGTAPDLAMVDSVWVARLAGAGFLYALADLDAPWNQSAFRKSLYPVFVEANSFENRLYGLPNKVDASLLWYRKDWDKFVNAASHFLQPQIQERYDLTYPLAFAGGSEAGEATVYSLLPFIWSAGGELLDTYAGCVVLDSVETSYALRFLRGLVQRHGISSPGVVGYGHDTSARLFVEGKVAMAMGGSH